MFDTQWPKLVVLIGGSTAAGVLLWYLFREGDDDEPTEDQPPTAASLQVDWPAGSLCVVHGLQSESGKQLNRRLGEVRGLDAESGRICVRMHPDDPPPKWKKLKADNLRRAPVAGKGPRCFMCQQGVTDEPLLRPCKCDASASGCHLKCLQIAALAYAEPQYPSCRLCKQEYDSITAVMLLENIRECWDAESAPVDQELYSKHLEFLATAYSRLADDATALT
eukprot:TRINITY_DN41490_c0_g1_i1.p1 TRINITY_DN41490_c0_g1~~TRINITY_DN41490_c0_g1_i1.p1  ORF type:complete len:222 (-),score=14.79 TRINITY_DN41490_c0_g1_i1:60-725(-)